MRDEGSYLGRYMQRFRRERNLTMSDLAEKLGVSPATVSRWEQGKVRPAKNYRDALADLMGADASELEILALKPVGSSNQTEDYWRREKELLAIGNDATRPLAVRRRALAQVIQTEADPWPPGLIEAYVGIFRNDALPLLDRLDLAFSVSAYGDPMRDDRVLLRDQALLQGLLPPKHKFEIASETGGATGLKMLLDFLADEDPKISRDARDRLGWLSHREREADAVRRAAFAASLGTAVRVGHVFVSYVREDADVVGRLQADLRTRGVELWKDTDRLRPGDRWRREISSAIRAGDAFIAVFSTASEAKPRSYMREELLQAIEELRLRPGDRAWFFPVLVSECRLPRLQIGPNEFLSDLQYAALYRDWDRVVAELAYALLDATVHHD